VQRRGAARDGEITVADMAGFMIEIAVRQHPQFAIVL
jgi:hypothetical protein